MDVARCNRVDAQVLCEITQERVPAPVATLERPLQLDVEAVAAERVRESLRRVRVPQAESLTHAAGQAHETFVSLRHGLERNSGRKRLAVLSTGPARLGVRGGEDPAEIRVALGALDEEGDMRPVLERHFRAGDRPQPYCLRGVGELERAVDAVVVGERERLVAELCRLRGQLLGMRRTVQERVRRVAVQLDVRGGTHGSPTSPLLLAGAGKHRLLASRPAKPASGHNPSCTEALKKDAGHRLISWSPCRLRTRRSGR